MNGLVGKAGLSSNSDCLSQSDDNDLSPDEYGNPNVNLKVGPTEQNHLPTLVNGETPQPSVTVKSEMITTRSAEDLTFIYQGDTPDLLLNSPMCKLEKAKCNGSWHSQSMESLYLNQSLLPVTLMAGDGPITEVNFAHSEMGFQKLTDSYRKRPRLL